VFHSLELLDAAVLSLSRPDGPIQVVRVKERFTLPLPSGYRDILLNVKIKGSDHVAELQLHLKDIIAHKKETHKIYDLMRAAGWDGDRTAEVVLSEADRAAARVSKIEVGQILEARGSSKRGQVAPAPAEVQVSSRAQVARCGRGARRGIARRRVGMNVRPVTRRPLQPHPSALEDQCIYRFMRAYLRSGTALWPTGAGAWARSYIHGSHTRIQVPRAMAAP